MATSWEGLEHDLLLAETLDENEVSPECWEAKETYITSLKTLMSDLDCFLRYTDIKSGLPLFYTDAPIEPPTSGIFDSGYFTGDTLWLDPRESFVSTGWPLTDRHNPQIQSESVNRKRKIPPTEIQLRPSSMQVCAKRSRKTAPSQSHETIHKLSIADFERQSANSASWLFNATNTTISSLSDTPPLVIATDLLPPASLIEPPAPSLNSLAQSSSKSAGKIPPPSNNFIIYRPKVS